MSDPLGRHTNECDSCKGIGKWLLYGKTYGKFPCPKCKGKGFVVEDLDKQIQRKIRCGDILLIKNKLDPIGFFIRLFTHCQWNHVAWFINEHEVVELTTTKKVTTPLKKYLNKFLYKIKLVRTTYISQISLKQAIVFAKSQKLHYSYSSAILAFILVKLHLSKYLKRPTCSGFIAQCLYTVYYKFNDKNPSLITPKNIEKSKFVEDVSYELPK